MIVATMLLTLILPAASARAQDATTAAQSVNIYLFWGEGCPHCAKAKPFLEGLDANSDAINLQEYEIYNNANNKKILQEIVAKLDINASGVPVIIIGDQAFVGYSEASSGQIEARVNQCLAEDCPDSVASIIDANSSQDTIAETKKTNIYYALLFGGIVIVAFGAIMIARRKF